MGEEVVPTFRVWGVALCTDLLAWGGFTAYLLTKSNLLDLSYLMDEYKASFHAASYWMDEDVPSNHATMYRTDEVQPA